MILANTGMIIRLKNAYPSIHGLPVIHSVDSIIFELTYFMRCMECTFCKDQCCEWGADIDLRNVQRIMKHESELEEFTATKSDAWFTASEVKWDHEYPGNDYVRTTHQKEKGYCVFHNPEGKGCMLHSFALQKGIDYHELKPFFCSMFPVTYNEGVLVIPEEIEENLTVCLGQGASLYRGARDEIGYYFGSDILKELDEAEAVWLSKKQEVSRAG